MNIKINNNLINQDNSVMQTNPILKTKLGKILLILGCIPVVAFIFLVDWKQIYFDNKKICMLEIFFFGKCYLCNNKLYNFKSKCT